jgi:hypothetical protein
MAGQSQEEILLDDQLFAPVKGEEQSSKATTINQP